MSGQRSAGTDQCKPQLERFTPNGSKPFRVRRIGHWKNIQRLALKAIGRFSSRCDQRIIMIWQCNPAGEPVSEFPAWQILMNSSGTFSPSVSNWMNIPISPPRKHRRSLYAICNSCWQSCRVLPFGGQVQIKLLLGTRAEICTQGTKTISQATSAKSSILRGRTWSSSRQRESPGRRARSSALPFPSEACRRRIQRKGRIPPAECTGPVRDSS